MYQLFIPNILATVSSSHFTAETVPFHSFDGACSNIETTLIMGAATMLRKSAIVRISRRACSTVPLTPLLLLMMPPHRSRAIFLSRKLQIHLRGNYIEGMPCMWKQEDNENIPAFWVAHSRGMVLP